MFPESTSEKQSKKEAVTCSSPPREGRRDRLKDAFHPPYPGTVGTSALSPVRYSDEVVFSL